MEVKEDEDMQVVIESHGQFNTNMEFCATIISHRSRIQPTRSKY
ncbi:uncharacterized protein G2W53_000656 [Senna tora]|uniref:Uncharacterized protein n=1 Tax=Senna tora TaxID=362788 RepID=A0A835CJN2_9FABA|nr:uncharacterized protein G2W53_000656 [Senna tora]